MIYGECWTLVDSFDFYYSVTLMRTANCGSILLRFVPKNDYGQYFKLYPIAAAVRNL